MVPFSARALIQSFICRNKPVAIFDLYLNFFSFLSHDQLEFLLCGTYQQVSTRMTPRVQIFHENLHVKMVILMVKLL